jgi:hypothetical protein
LPQLVRQRLAQQVRNAKRIKVAVAGTATAVVLLLIVASITAPKPPALPGVGAPVDVKLAGQPPAEPGANGSNVNANEQWSGQPVVDAAEIARLKSQADALGVEADALQRQITLARAEQTRQDLRDEYRRQLAADVQADTQESPIDRAAAIALCQGDYYWEQKARQPAQAAYQSVLDNFPQSHWAEVARERLSQFQMN